MKWQQVWFFLRSPPYLADGHLLTMGSSGPPSVGAGMLGVCASTLPLLIRTPLSDWIKADPKGLILM